MAQSIPIQNRYNSHMGHKILVVDDELTLVNTLCAYLEQEGFIVHAAHDGRSALNLLVVFN